MSARSVSMASTPSFGVHLTEAGPAMTSQYNPKDHIQPLVVAPRSDSILDQREITVTSYQTTVPFDFLKFDVGLEAAWLSPQVRIGVFSRIETTGRDSLNVVLGLQDELTIRAYDYDERRPLWYSWRNAIVDTANVHYFRDENGFLRFTVTGGGRRITDDRLDDFNLAFLEIPRDAVSKCLFDLERLRELCFKRFAERLFTIRFTEPSGDEYRSIDHALFQSRQYIDPDAERLKEIRDDLLVKVESFESDIKLASDDLASPVQVRFHIRGLSGSLRLRFPKLTYRNQIKTPEEEANVFYRIVDSAVRAILDEDYYTDQQLKLDELSTDLGLFPDNVDLTPFRKSLSSEAERKAFISSIDLGEKWPKWSPHLQALHELVGSVVIATHVRSEFAALAKRDPSMTLRVLAECQADPRKVRIGAIVASVLVDELHRIDSDRRAQVEEALLFWAIEKEEDSWDIDLDVDTSEFKALNRRWRLDDISLDVIPTVIWKLAGILHSRLRDSTE